MDFILVMLSLFRSPVRLALPVLLLVSMCCQPGSPEPQRRMFRETRDALATYVSITVVAGGEQEARGAIDAGFEELDRLTALFNWWDPDSELSRVNREAGKKPVTVSDELAELSRTALALAEDSEGAFDPTAGPLIRVWNVTRATRPPDPAAIHAAREQVGYRNVSIEGNEIRFLSEGVEFNLGGIAKGYMADMVAAALQKRGIPGGLIAVAGDIRAFGLRPDGRPWRVGIQDPRSSGLIAQVDLGDGAVSTSGDYERFFEFEGVRYHHILDPATGYPARGTQSVTVITSRAVMADGLATALFAMGPARAMEYLTRESIPGLIVDADHRVLISPAGRGQFSVGSGEEGMK